MTEYRGQGTADASTATTTSILRETATATSGQTVFNLSTAVYTPGTNELSVYVEGVRKLLTTDYTETSSSVVTFGSGVTLNEVVEFIAIVGGTAVSTTDATLSVFTHDNTGAVQTTVDEALKALAVDLTADLKAIAGAEVQTAYVRGRDTVGDGLGGFYFWNSTSTATDTSATTTLVVQQNGVTTGRWVKNTFNTFAGSVTIGGDLTIDGTTESTTVATGSIQTDGGLGVTKNAVIGQDLVLSEQADHSSTPANGYGYLWVKTGAPSTLQFTDDAGSDTDISAAGGTVTVADEAVDTTCFPIFSTAATGSISPKSNAALTYNSATADLASTTFTGALVGNADTATTAATVTTAAQTSITSLGTLTSLDVDNIQLDTNTITTTSGGLTLDSTSGTTTVADALTITGAFTSIGINDDATSVALTIDGSENCAFTGNIFKNATNGSITVSGGSAAALGANIAMLGESQVGQAGDMLFRFSTNTWMQWDESEGDLEIKTGSGAKTSALTLDASQNATFAGDVTVTGSVIASPVYQTKVATTSGTSVTLATGIPSTATTVQIMFNGVSTSGTSYPIIQLGDSGGFEATGYTGVVSVTSGAGALSDGFKVSMAGMAATDVFSGIYTLTRYESSSNTWVCEGSLGQSTATIYNVNIGGIKSLTSALTQIQITTQGGSDTFDAGDMRVTWS